MGLALWAPSCLSPTIEDPEPLAAARSWWLEGARSPRNPWEAGSNKKYAETEMSPKGYE